MQKHGNTSPQDTKKIKKWITIRNTVILGYGKLKEIGGLLVRLKAIYNTLDIDNSNKEYLQHIVRKLEACANCVVYKIIDTPKGYHVKMRCRISCDTCRFVFDDPARYEIDFQQSPALTNVLFKPYSAVKIETKIVLCTPNTDYDPNLVKLPTST